MIRIEKKIITFRQDGTMEHIYNEELTKKIISPDFETIEIRRATVVEPDPENPGTWYADLTKSGGPFVKGFKNRSEAIEYEIKYLNENYL